MPFLTELDPRATVTSSRDPLGLQPIWLALGRRAVVNLTTITTSVRNFTTLLVGLYYAEQAVRRGVADEKDRVSCFLAFEQLAAYTRFHVSRSGQESPDAPMGLRRVKSRLSEHDKVTISAAPEHQILANQQAYGIWGLYTVAARNSGLVERGSNLLTDLAREFVEADYAPVLASVVGKDAEKLFKYFRRAQSFDPGGANKDVADVLWKILKRRYRAGERSFYEKTLVLAAHSDKPIESQRQAEMWSILRELNTEGGFNWKNQFGFDELRAARKLAKKRGLVELEGILADIEVAEPVLVASAALFGFLLNRSGASIDTIESEVRTTWGSGLRYLRVDEFAALGETITHSGAGSSFGRLISLARQLHVGDFRNAIMTALELNDAVMRGRNGAAWITASDGLLRVRLVEGPMDLPDAGAMPSYWWNSYLLNSLKLVGGSLAQGGAA